MKPCFPFVVVSYTVIGGFPGEKCKVLVHIKLRDTAVGYCSRSPEVCRMYKWADLLYKFSKKWRLLSCLYMCPCLFYLIHLLLMLFFPSGTSYQYPISIFILFHILQERILLKPRLTLPLIRLTFMTTHLPFLFSYPCRTNVFFFSFFFFFFLGGGYTRISLFVCVSVCLCIRLSRKY